MITRALLIGYGRAGRRLGRGLDALGVEWGYIDPNNSSLDIKNWGKTFSNLSIVDFALIATPPALHLSQIRQCLDAGLPVLCEKPLCGWGQLAEAESLASHPLAGKVGMAFNYRWHPALDILSYHRVWEGELNPYAALSAQHRECLPEWGLVLDHLPHTIDTLLCLSGAETMTVDRASYRKNDSVEIVSAGGLLDGQKWNLSDAVFSYPVNKVAWVDGPFGLTQVETPPLAVDRMTQAMLAQWLGFVVGRGDYPAKLGDGIKVQKILEQIKEKV